MYNRYTILLLSASLTIAGGATAQQPDLEAGLAAVPTATLQATAALIQGTLLVDEPRPGEVWARGDTYKAAFTDAGTTFYPFFGSEAPRHFPVLFAPPEVRQAGTLLATIDAAPQQNDDRVTFHRGGLVEQFLLTADGIEQTFVFHTLESRSALSLRIPVATELQGEAHGEGLRFASALGAVTYGQAVAIDATGARLPLSTQWINGSIEVTVPSAFVAKAALPLVIDPLIMTQMAGVTGPVGIGNSDLAFDHQTGTYLLVYEQPYNALDHDVYGVRLDGGLTLLGLPFAIDYTSDSWTLPRVANHRLAQQFLTVAEVHSASTADIYIAGRTTEVPSLTQSGQLEIARAGVVGHMSGSKFRPDVGGSAGGNPTNTNYYLVVWEREYAQFDHDVHARMVATDGTLVGAGAMLLSNSTLYDARPAVSKSSVHSDRWHICYQRQLFGTTADWDILGARVNRSGTVLGTDETIAGNLQFQGNCSVSSPTVMPGFPVVVAFENRLTITGEPNLQLVLVDQDGNPGAPYQLTGMEAIAVGSTGFMTFEQVRPSVATDGARCVVSYREKNTTTTSYDTYLTLVGIDTNGALSIQEPRVAVTSSPLGGWIDDNPASICSRWDAAHQRVRYDVTADWQDLVTNVHGVGVWGYDGHTTNGGYAMRATGCGNLGIVASGPPAYGGGITFQVTNATGMPGFLVGTPANYSFSVCPQCTVGVQGTSVLGIGTIDVNIPPQLSFLGMTFSVQGLEIVNSGGSCLAQFNGSPTIDFTIL